MIQRNAAVLRQPEADDAKTIAAARLVSAPHCQKSHAVTSRSQATIVVASPSPRRQATSQAAVASHQPTAITGVA
jgi:hypothetical protein